MSKEEIVKILSKIKDTVGENNYKLALAITGHKTGKIKDIIMCSKDGELLLKYIEQLEQQCRKQKEVIDKLNIRIEENKKNIDESGSFVETYTGWKLIPEILEELLDILKEVSE